MHIILIIFKVIGGLAALAFVLVALFAWLVTKDGNNPFR